ncbi:MAG: hypothetical protein VKL23_06275 [Cyanobacteriota bacterium]|nr:hypothetical protein [Cyanobacteriota bacterium]
MPWILDRFAGKAAVNGCPKRLHYIDERLTLMENDLASPLEQEQELQQNVVIDQFRRVCKLLHRRIKLTRNALAFASLCGLLIALDVGTPC